MATEPSPSAAAEPASYEVALRELESLVASMEGGQLPLEGLLAGYRRGTELLEKDPRLAALQIRLPGRLRNGDIERG